MNYCQPTTNAELYTSTSFNRLLAKAAVTACALLYSFGAIPEAQAVEPTHGKTGTTLSPGASDVSSASDTGVSNISNGESKNTTAGKNPSQEEVRGLSWINQQPAGNYTLQLMVAVSAKPLLTFARKESLSAPLAVAVFRRGDDVLHLLLQGSYTSRSEADSAAALFEQETGAQPWVRRFSSLPELFDTNSPPPRQAVTDNKPPIKVVGAAWLWSRNPVRYTIQLMADRRADSLRAFVAEQRPDGPVAIVRVKRKGKPWYLLLAGDYASQEEAVAAIAALPQRASVRGPWPRRFASLQDQMVAGNH
jgi:septal ring-binding cell division protein DamX